MTRDEAIKQLNEFEEVAYWAKELCFDGDGDEPAESVSPNADTQDQVRRYRWLRLVILEALEG